MSTKLSQFFFRDVDTPEGKQYYQHHKDQFLKLWRFCQENGIKSFDYCDVEIIDNSKRDPGYALIRFLRQEPDIAGYIDYGCNGIHVDKEWCNESIPRELHRQCQDHPNCKIYLE